MAYLVEADLYGLIYQDKLDEIKRSDATLVDKAINGAISFAKSYLSRFDLLKLFGDDVTAPTITDQNLKDQVIAIACYKLVRLSNPGLDLEEFRMYYEDAEAWLKNVQKGYSDPDGWVTKAANEVDGTNPGALVTWNSQTKRNDNY